MVGRRQLLDAQAARERGLTHMKMQEQVNKPIFVVGSPRSGTSILTWCLGHHPNIFPLPESNWMGEFAVNLGVCYQSGAARGDYSILSAMDIVSDELFAAFGRSINDLILRHRSRLEKTRETRCEALKLDPRWLHAASAAAGPKNRWADGTPGYSTYIFALRKLFPAARFVHIVRDVRAVVRSLLNFHRVAGTQLAPNEERAYQIWLRNTKACIKAEQAYGPSVIHRVRYADLVNRPESTMGSLLEFLEEPYTAKCLEPLAQRINSSNVPSDFIPEGPGADPAMVEEACRLSAELEHSTQPQQGSPAVAREMEAAFEQRVRYIAGLEAQKSRLESSIAGLQKELDDLRTRIAHARDTTLASEPGAPEMPPGINLQAGSTGET
jgi:hypothetical protein